jgi:hypothetical protein
VGNRKGPFPTIKKELLYAVAILNASVSVVDCKLIYAVSLIS